MASADTATAARADWPLSNPWTWALTGMAAAVLALAWVHLLGERAPAVRGLLIIVGLLAAGGAVALRLTSSGGAYLESLTPPRRRVALLALALGGLTLAASAIGLLAASLLDLDIPWETGGVVVVAALVMPAGLGVAVHALRCAAGRPVSARAESALVLLAGAVSAFLACWALYVDEAHGLEWDTMRLPLAVLALVALAGAGLVLLPVRARRLVVTALAVLHFGGMATAALSPTPSPWIIGQLWVRFYRPYLQFMYLNNAYHFYAPEPGPSSYLWCRLEYQSAGGEHHWHWIKFPEIDEHGQHGYPTALSYQRRLAFLENSRGFDPAPPMYINNQHKQPVMNPLYYWRAVNSPNQPEPVLGQSPRRPALVVPFHTQFDWWTQYAPLSDYGRLILHSVARHLATVKHPDYPDDRFVKVKIYRVTHVVMHRDVFAFGKFGPDHPVMFLPYYQGEYDAEGELLDYPRFDADGNLLGGDPFLYWLLPTLPEDADNPKTAVYAYVFLHAGDPHWCRPYNSKEWTEAPNPAGRLGAAMP
jgi:hypothetical protein